MSKNADGPKPARSIPELAAELVRLAALRDPWRQGPGSLQALTEFEAHRLANPDAGDELMAALEDVGAGVLTLLYLPLAELGLVPLVVMRQRAVGHGGFHTGALGYGAAKLRWVYDCGALKATGRTRLTEEIDELIAGRGDRPPLDFLFLSHFDRDHINGVETLMEKVQVKTVVLPYLEDIDRLAILAEMGINDTADQTTVAAIADPAAWLRTLGAERIVLVRPAREGASSPIFTDDGTGSAPEDAGRGGEPVFVPHGPASVGADGVMQADTGSGWAITHWGGTVGDWCFVPYVMPASRTARDAVAEALDGLLDREPKETFVAAFQRKLDDTTFIPDLKAVYAANDLGASNVISMSLYVGPCRDMGWISRRSLPCSRHAKAGPGWLLTGDAKLAQKGRRANWLQFFEPVKKYIGALMLPHHGSRLNFDEAILSAGRDDALVFACKQPKAGAPLHPDVWEWVQPLWHHIVTEDEASTLIQASGASALDTPSDELRTTVETWA